MLFPKKHYAIMPQVPEDIQGHLLVIAKKLSRILLKTFKVDGTNFFAANGAAAYQRAQHFLIHIIPRKGGDGILNIEEKLVSREMVSKVKTAVEGKLQELLGFKKNVNTKKYSGESREEIQEINGNEEDENQENANLENGNEGNKEIGSNEKNPNLRTE